MYQRMLTIAAACATLQAPAARTQELLVYRVPIDGSINISLSRVVARAIQVAEREGGVAVILDIESTGGRIDAAQSIVEDVGATHVRVYTLVSQGWWAAALVALSADSIFMESESSLGAGPAASNPSDNVSAAAARAMRNEFRALAERRGLDPRIGEAMIDPRIVIPGVVKSGELLTLDARAALRLGLAADTVDDLDDLLATVGLAEARVVTVDARWMSTTVHVENRNWRDVRIYLTRGGTRFRLGTVTSMNSEEFELPERSLVTGSVIRVLAEVIGSSERIATDEIVVESGLVIEWAIENVLSHSNYFIFVRR